MEKIVVITVVFVLFSGLRSFFFELLVFFAIAAVVGLLIMVGHARGQKLVDDKRKAQKSYLRNLAEGNREYSREIPFDRYLPAVHWAFSGTDHSDILKAYLLAWSKKGLVIVGEAERRPGKRREPFIVFEKNDGMVNELPGIERKLYDFLFSAARRISNTDRDNTGNPYSSRNLGSSEPERYLLQEASLWSHCRKNYRDITSLHELFRNAGEKYLLYHNLVDHNSTAQSAETQSFLRGLVKIANPIPVTEQAVNSLMGFRKYLLHFAEINNGKVAEADLWDEYLVFAVMLIAVEEASGQFDLLDPEYLRQSISPLDPGISRQATLSAIKKLSRSWYSGYTSGMTSRHT